MKIPEHADEIRRRLLMALEEAEQTPDPERRRVLQTVLVVGAGPPGWAGCWPRTGCGVDRGGRVEVEADFSIPGRPDQHIGVDVGLQRALG